MSAGSGILRHDGELADLFDTEPGSGSCIGMRATRDDVEQIGVTAFASPPPPPLSINWLVLGQLGLLLAVVLFVWGEWLLGRVMGG